MSRASSSEASSSTDSEAHASPTHESSATPHLAAPTAPEVPASDPSPRPRGRARPQRPSLPQRKSSGTIVVPRNHPALDGPGAAAARSYGPEDARGMSPRRSSNETEALSAQTRDALHRHARRAQSELREIAESIELVKQDHAKLEQQNQALQHYIGGLTRSLSKSGGVGGAGSGRKGRGKTK